MTNKKLNLNFLPVYDMNDINQWKNSFVNIPMNEVKEEENIQALSNQLAALNRELVELNPSAAPIEFRIRQIEAQKSILNNQNKIKSLTDSMTDIEKEIKSTQIRQAEVESAIANYNVTVQGLERQIAYKITQEQVDGLEDRKRILGREINNLKNDLVAKTTESSTLQLSINSLEADISRMRNLEREQRAAFHHHDAKIDIQPSAPGFGSTMTQHSDGFNSSMISAPGFQSSLHQSHGFNSSKHKESGYQSSRHSNHGFNSTKQSNRFDDDPLVSHHIPSARNIEKKNAGHELEAELSKLHAKQVRLKADIQSIKSNIQTKEAAIERATKDVVLQETLQLMYSYQDKYNPHSKFQLEIDLRDARITRSSKIEEKKQLAAAMMRLQNQSLDKSTQIKNLQDEIKVKESLRGEYDKIDDIAKLDDLIKKEQQNVFIQQKKSLQYKIDCAQSGICQSKDTLKQLRNTLHELNTNKFKSRITNEPETLITELVDGVQTIIKNQEKHYPANQSNKVRTALVNLSDNLNAMQNIPIYESTYRNYTGDLINQQKRFFQYCGLLWTELKELADQDSYLGQALLEMLQANPIQCAAAVNEYDKLKLKRQDIKEVETNELVAYGKVNQAFMNALNPYKTTKNKDQNQLYKSGSALIDATAADLAKERKGNAKQGTLKFYTTMLQVAVQLMQTRDEETMKELQSLIKESHIETPLGQRVLKSLTTGFGLFADKTVEVETAANDFLRDFKNIKNYIDVATPAVSASENNAVTQMPGLMFQQPSAPPIEEPTERLYPDVADLKFI